MFAKLYGLPSMSADAVEQRLGQPGFYVYDNNTERVWKKGHVPGAKNFDPADYSESDLPADKSATLVFYCSGFTCGAAPYAARRAKKMGYANVFVMTDGISGWMEGGRPVEIG